MYKSKKLIAACLSACMLSSTVSPVIQTFASTENPSLKGEIREEENYEAASPSNAQLDSTTTNYLQVNTSRIRGMCKRQFLHYGTRRTK